MTDNWIDRTMQELTDRKAYGKLVLHYEHGKVQRLTIEESVMNPDRQNNKRTGYMHPPPPPRRN